MTDASDVPGDVDASEDLGRAIFDSDKAAQAAKGKVHPKVFREKEGVRELSVDRVAIAPEQTLATLHDAERPGKTFWGWATISYDDACKMERTVRADPILHNAWHAEIVLPPLSKGEEKDEQVAHSVNLARLSRWKPRPAVPPNGTDPNHLR